MDLNVRAFRVVQVAISGHTESAVTDARKAAARKGGLAGGPSRASLLPQSDGGRSRVRPEGPAGI